MVLCVGFNADIKRYVVRFREEKKQLEKGRHSEFFLLFNTGELEKIAFAEDTSKAKVRRNAR